MKWILLTMILAASSVAVTVADWSGRINVDAMTDAETIVISTYDAVALLGTLFLGTDLPPEFMVVFQEGDNVPIIGVSYSKYIGSTRSSNCLARIDDEPAVEYQVAIEGEKIMLIIGSNESKEFFANLLRGNELMIRFRPAGQAQITTSFSLSGITGVSRALGIDVDYYLGLAEQQTSSGGFARSTQQTSSGGFARSTQQTSSAGMAPITIENGAILEIYTDFLGRTFDVYVKSAGESSWGSVWNTGHVNSSYNVYFDIQPSVYDIKIEIDNGEVYIQNNVHIVDWYTFEVNLERPVS